ncbi:unnamed protein product [Hyaloperonospora brassicae]|uniref:RxLR effector candidate protein n=1 Tax=Hyaloperonospora brassicae TaxID=162125 RepID=A0AAV0U9B8_HYABA|nr:unnamed protein product [Hyaloperonospora brassicae]
MTLSAQRKESKRTWPDHFLYVAAIGGARDSADTLVVNEIVNHASAYIEIVIKAKCDPSRIEHLRHAKELAHFAQLIETIATSIGKEVVAEHVDAPSQRKETRKCVKVGHIQANCRSSFSNSTGGGDAARLKDEYSKERVCFWILQSAGRERVEHERVVRTNGTSRATLSKTMRIYENVWILDGE